MSNFKKHAIFILMAMLVLIMIPMSFAADNAVSDSMGISDTSDDSLESTDNSVLSEDMAYTTTPSPSSVEYTIGESCIINVTADYISDEEDYFTGLDMTGSYMHVYIDENDITLEDVDSEVKSFKIDLNDLEFDFVADKTYSLEFHPSNGFLTNAVGVELSECQFNKLTVAVKAAQSIDAPDAIYVDVNGNDTNNGSSDSPVATIAKAIELASKGKIIVNKGTYEEHDLNITSALDISADGEVIIDALKLGRIFNIDTAETVNVTGITFKNAKSTANGGAIYIKDAKTTIDNCNFLDNEASAGSAIFWNADDGCLTNSFFTNNTARNAVVKIGQYSWSTRKTTGANTKIENCVFDDNHNVVYGNSIGIDIETGCADVSILKCNFTNNIGETGSDKGAVYTKGTDTIIDGCLFENNAMDRAPAILIDGDSENVKVTNSKFINNTIVSAVAARSGAIEIQNMAEITGNTFIRNGGDECIEGGAINIVYAGYDGGDVVISDNEFIENSATYGGAIHVDGGSEDWSEFDSLTISNNNFTKNTADEGSAIYVENSGNEIIIEDNTIVAYDNQPIFVDEDTAYDVTEENNKITVIYSGIIYVDMEGNDNNTGDDKNPVKTILKAIELATSEDNKMHKIVIRAGTYSETNLNITSALEIVGEDDVVIDAQAMGRIFKITGSDNVTLTNMFLINGLAPADLKGGSYWNPRYYSAGGAILIDESPKVTIDGLVFINNTAGDYGGAIDWEADDGLVKNSIFWNNTAGTLGGAIDWEGADGIVINATFSGNNASNRGGAIDWEGDSAIILNSTFEYNTASTGAAVYMLNTRYSEGNLIQGCTFDSNNASQQGGAINVENEYQRSGLLETVVLNNTFINNYGYNGGAISDYYGSIDAVNNTFIGNTAAYGAAIANSGRLYLEGNKITNCKASELGTIYNIGDIASMLNVVFINGKTITINDGKAVELNATVVDDMGNAISGGEVTFYVNNNTTLYKPSTLTDGLSTVKFVAHENGTLTVDGFYSVLNNVTKGYLNVSNAVPDYFGVIYVSDSEGNDDNLGTKDSPVKTFDQGMLLATREKGSYTIVVKSGHYDVSEYEIYGGINITGEGNPVLDAKYRHGILSLYGEEDTNFTISGITFINGNATPSTYAGNQAGGALFVKGGNLYLSDSTFMNCTAGGYGGAIHINQGSRSFAPYSYTTYATITNCTFENNGLDDNTPYNYHAGGAICVYSKAVVDISDSTFTNNFARYGGAIGFTSTSTSNVTITNSKFKNNSALRDGGAIYLEAYDNSEYSGSTIIYHHWEVNIVNSTFEDNKATNGAAMDVANANVDGCTFKNNNASSNAGAIYVNGNANITNNEIINNTAGDFAGAILISEYSGFFSRIYEITLSNNTMSENSANYSDEIYTFSKVNIHGVNITVLDNTTKKFCEGNITIYASVTDDMGNEISAEDFTFIINGTEYVTFVENGIAQVSYAASLNDTGIIVNATLKAASEAVANIGILEIIPYGINITVADVSVKYGENLTVPIDVIDAAGNPVAGNLSVSVNGEESIVPIENGVATVSVISPKVGEYEIVASFDNFTSNKTAVVEAIKTNITSKDVNATQGSVEVSATLVDEFNNPIANQTISFNVAGGEFKATTDANGVASVKLPLIADVYDVEITHVAEGYVPGSTNITVNIAKPASKGQIVIDTVSGDKVISAALKDVDGNGIAGAVVEYTVDGVKQNATTGSNGAFEIQAASNSKVVISYAGNDKALPVNTTVTLKDVAKLRANTTIVGDDYETYAIDYYAGERGGYFKVKLVDDAGKILANKSVKIGFNGKVYNTTTDSEGIAQLQINLAKAGTYTFAVAFLGDGDYNASFTVKSITVNLKKTSISASAKSYKASAKTKSYTVTLKTDKGSSIDGKTYMASGKTVKLTVNGKTYTAKTNAKGQATFKLDISKKGTYNANVNFAGDNTYKSCKATTKITIN